MKRIRLGTGDYKYDVRLSFAGDDRRYVERVLDDLCKTGLIADIGFQSRRSMMDRMRRPVW